MLRNLVPLLRSVVPLLRPGANTFAFFSLFVGVDQRREVYRSVEKRRKARKCGEIRVILVLFCLGVLDHLMEVLEFWMRLLPPAGVLVQYLTPR